MITRDARKSFLDMCEKYRKTVQTSHHLVMLANEHPENELYAKVAAMHSADVVAAEKAFAQAISALVLDCDFSRLARAYDVLTETEYA